MTLVFQRILLWKVKKIYCDKKKRNELIGNKIIYLYVLMRPVTRFTVVYMIIVSRKNSWLSWMLAKYIFVGCVLCFELKLFTVQCGIVKDDHSSTYSHVFVEGEREGFKCFRIPFARKTQTNPTHQSSNVQNVVSTAKIATLNLLKNFVLFGSCTWRSEL